MMIPYGAFRPDVGGPNTGFAEIADNVLPQAAASGIGYGPMPALNVPASATALPGAPRGSILLRLFDGTRKVYFGTANTLEELASDFTWTNRATGLNVTDGDDISFAQFGSYLLNTNTTDGFKALNIETPAGNDTVVGAPTARSIFVCNNVVFALDCNGNNKRMQSSGLGDHTAWDRLGANGKTFEDGGSLICGKDLKNGVAVVFQDDAMRLIQFGGAPGGALYTINKIADGRGTTGERSVVAFDGLVFYWATDGNYKFTLAGGNEPIGAEKINRWFLRGVDQARMSEIQGSVDPLNKIVWWRTPMLSDGATTVFQRMIGYDWQIGEYVTATVQTSALARLSTTGFTLDNMDDFGPLDGIDIPLDSRFFQGGQPVFAGLDENYKFGSFSGAAMAATLRSCIINNPVTGLVTWVTPISNAPNSTLRVGANDNLSEDIAFGPAGSKERNGAVSTRVRGMNLQFEEEIPAGESWLYANGVDHINKPNGGKK